MIMSGKTDPYDCLVETLMSDRYNAVIEALIPRVHRSLMF